MKSLKLGRNPYYKILIHSASVTSYYLKSADYVVVAWAYLQTANTFKFNRYATSLVSRFYILDNPDNLDNRIIHEACAAGFNQANIAIYQEDTDTPYTYENTQPTYKEMFDNGASLLKNIFDEVTNRFIDHYLKSATL